MYPGIANLTLKNIDLASHINNININTPKNISNTEYQHRPNILAHASLKWPSCSSSLPVKHLLSCGKVLSFSQLQTLLLPIQHLVPSMQRSSSNGCPRRQPKMQKKTLKHLCHIATYLRLYSLHYIIYDYAIYSVRKMVTKIVSL